MAHGTFKPCPGCKEDAGYRPVNGVCKGCEQLLQAGRAVQEEKRQKAEKGKVFRLPAEWPHVYSPSSSGNERPSDKELHKAWGELARAALKPLRSTRNPYDKEIEPIPAASHQVHYLSGESRPSLWTGTRRLADAITRLDLAVRKAILDAFHEGKVEGSDLLMSLARGEVSVNELTEAQIEAGRRK